MFATQIRLVQEWRGFPFVDLALPRELHPTPWPGTGAAELFRRRHGAWHPAAQVHWSPIVRAAER